MEIIKISPNQVSFDSHGHIRRREPQMNNQLKQNVNKLGYFVEPIHIRDVDGELKTFDGMNRVKVAQKLGISVPAINYGKISTSDALQKSLILNDDTAGIMKETSDSDRRKALFNLLYGERKDPPKSLDYETEISSAMYDLGMKSLAQHLQTKLRNVSGISQKRSERLAETFGSIDDLLDADKEEIMDINGFGEKTAENLLYWIKRNNK